MNLPLAKNWNELITPSKLVSENIDGNPNAARIIVEPLERGFAMTLGNSLRRVLLSSLQGGAVTAVRVSGVEHEFSAIQGVAEDMVDVILNLKSLVVKMHVDEKRKIWLRATGPCVVTAGMIEAGNDVEILNPDHEICTLSEGASLEMELTCEMGKGYVPAGRARDEDLPIGVMRIDSVFSPVRKVSYKVENARVAQITDYDCLIMEVETNGTVDPGMAIAIAARILQKELQILITFEELEEEQEEEKDVLPFNPVLLKRIGDIEITVRSQNCLRNENIVYIGDLATKTENEMLKTPNFGRKSLNELKQILHRYGLTFGMKIPEWPPENCDELSKKYQEDRD